MRKVYKVGNTYFDIEKINNMTEIFVDEGTNHRGIEIKNCYFWINDERYHINNFEGDYQVEVTSETERKYQEFKKEADILLNAFISR